MGFNQPPLLSVVVPCFNGEQYIEVALESVITQFGNSAEIIVVDDGSTDGTRVLIEQYVAQYGDIVYLIISERNIGVGAARNLALDLCRGKYIGFLDADDFYLPDLAEVTIPLMECGVDDVIEYGFKRFSGSGELLNPKYTPLYDFSGSYDMDAVRMRVFTHTVWYPSIRFYRKELWANVRFPAGVHYEDLMTIPNIFIVAKTIYFINRSFLAYREHAASITARHTNIQLLDLMAFYWKTLRDDSCFDIYRLRLARSISYFSHELGCLEKPYYLIRNDACRKDALKGNVHYLMWPDRLYIEAPRLYDFINLVRTGLRKWISH